MQSFVTDKAESPSNVLARQALMPVTPTLALKDGEPYLWLSARYDVRRVERLRRLTRLDGEASAQAP